MWKGRDPGGKEADRRAPAEAFTEVLGPEPLLPARGGGSGRSVFQQQISPAGSAAWNPLTWVGEPGDLYKQVFFRKAFREHEESRSHSTLQVLIQGRAEGHILIHRHDLHLEKQDVQKKTSWSGALPNLGVTTRTGAVQNPQPWRYCSVRPVDME